MSAFTPIIAWGIFHAFGVLTGFIVLLVLHRKWDIDI